MLERPANQAAGLLKLASPQAPQLMAVVNHGDETAELALLWRLCSSLVDFGYAVTVLDATTYESEANPGLEQLLEYAYWRGNENADAPAWNVIASGRGLQTLAGMPQRKQQSLQHLGQLFLHEGVLIVYGHAALLTPLLAHSGIQPLLAIAAAKRSLLSSYLALKRLLLKGGLEPTIVNLVQAASPAASPKVHGVVSSLSDCARIFLGFEVNAFDVTSSNDDDRPCATIQRLALRMLESALPLTTDMPNTPSYPPHPGIHPSMRSH